MKSPFNEEETYREGIKDDLREIKKMVAYTNGKVKKIIIVYTPVAPSALVTPTKGMIFVIGGQVKIIGGRIYIIK